VTYIGEAEAVVPYFANLGFPCPAYTNPADFIFMKILNVNAEGKQEEEHKQRIRDAWQASKEQWNVKAMIKHSSMQGLKDVGTVTQATASSQFKLLSIRAGRNLVRDKMMLRGRLAQTLATSVIMGSIYWQIENFQRNIQVRVRACMRG
jgi:ATP-binding cassette subfamily G (WHITE) protein 1